MSKDSTKCRVETTQSAYLETADGETASTRIPIEVRTTVEDPFRAFQRVREDTTESVLLETSGGNSGWCYAAVNPIERLQVNEDAEQLDSAVRNSSNQIANGSHSLEALDAVLQKESLRRGECEVPYPCGVFGWLSYDIAREIESLPDETPSSNLPRLQAGLFESVIAWKVPQDSPVELQITHCPPRGTDPRETYQNGIKQAKQLARTCTHHAASVDQHASYANTDVQFKSECGREKYADRVRQVKEYITAGDTFQANISHRLVAPAPIESIAVYDALREVNPAPYSAFVEFRNIDLISASPELLLETDGETLVTEPIAGTRPRGETSKEDRQLETDLLADEKEAAEHAMLVDLERNDIGKVSSYGTVDVSEHRRIDRYASVMHLVSKVTGNKESSFSLADSIAAVFPGGTITGAPKPRTMEIIESLEQSRRGPYTGSIGVFGFDGKATLNITIRTITHVNSQFRLRVGAGIVHDSIPEAEYAETLDKAGGLIEAMNEALGERTSLSVAQHPIESVHEETVDAAQSAGGSQ